MANSPEASAKQQILNEHDDETFARLWPASRIVMGLRVCTSLRRRLLVAASEVLLVGRRSEMDPILEERIVADICRFQSEHLQLHIQVPYWLRVSSRPGRGARRDARERGWEGGGRGEGEREGEEREGEWGGHRDGIEHRESGERERGARSTDAVASPSGFLCVLAEKTSRCVCSLDLGHSVDDNPTEDLDSSEQLHMALHQLSFEDVVGPSLSEDAFSALGVLVNRSTSMQSLKLFSARMGPDKAVQLSQTAPLLDQLTHLDLGKNDLNDSGVTAISSMLTRCTHLQTLILSGNFCSPQGATSLAEALPTCGALKHLSLATNWIQDEGGYAVSKAFRHCSQLTHLDLSDNELTFSNFTFDFTENAVNLAAEAAGRSGSNWLAAALPALPSLSALILSANSPGEIWPRDLEAIGSALAESNPELQRLEVAGMELEESAWLQAALRDGSNGAGFACLTLLDLRDNNLLDLPELQQAASALTQLRILV